MKDMRRELNETLDRVKKVNIADMVKKDFDELTSEFLPGLELKPNIILKTIAFLTIAITWLLVYFNRFYHNDRCEHLSHWGLQDEGIAPDVEDPVHDALEETLLPHDHDVSPDVVIVFHHPTFEGTPDRETAAASSDLRHALVEDPVVWCITAIAGIVRQKPSSEAVVVTEKQRGVCIRGFLVDGWVALEGEPGYMALQNEDGSPQLERVGAGGASGKGFHAFRSVIKDASDFELATSPLAHLKRARETLGSWSALHHEGAEPPCRRAARTALLQDLYSILPTWGFDVKIFSSIDDDELYLCISLEEAEAIESYLLRTGTTLQIRQDIVPKLGVKQPQDEVMSSPPFLRFDPRVIKNLAQAGVLNVADARELFKTHYGTSKDGIVVKSSDRFSMIFRQISAHLDLDYAVTHDLIVDWYPAHGRSWLNKLSKSWGNFHLLSDLTQKQPIPLIHDYFGSRVAFIFAWNGFYCKALLALSVLAIPTEMATQALASSHNSATIHKRVVLAFSILIIIWARLAKNFWMREQQYFVALWDMTEETTEPVRPSFHGEKLPSEADYNLLEKQYPAHSAAMRRCCSTLITLAFCVIVGACIIVWTQIFSGRMDLVASVALSLMIVVFQQVYNLMVPRLTEWENHKHQSTYYNSYVVKQFLFESVNRYAAFFFLAVKQRHTAAGCPAGGCMYALKTQLWMTLLILSLTRIMQIIVASVVVNLKIKWEDYQLKQRHAEKDVLPKRSFTELQSKFAPARLQEQIDSMMQLVLALGFILLFGAVAPIIVPYCLAVFVIQMRGRAFMMVKFSKRAVPRQQYGIGIWATIIQTVMNASVLFSGFLIVTFGDLFAGTPLLTKLAGILIYVMCMQIVWMLVDTAYPPHSHAVGVLKARRQRVKTVLLERATDFTVDAQGDQSPGTPRGSVKAGLANEVQRGEWDKILHMEDSFFRKR